MESLNLKRCFAFGCSYTQWIWPTWADLIGCNFETYYNFGMSGSDNTYALNRLIDTHELFRLNPQTDLVLFGITGHGRFTWWDNETDWNTKGDYNFDDTTNAHQLLSDGKYSPVWAAYRSVNAIRNFKYLLEAMQIPHIIIPALDNLEFNHVRLYKKDRMLLDKDAINACKSLEKLYTVNETLDEFIFNLSGDFHPSTLFEKENRKETHPTVKTHFDYVKKHFPIYDTEKSRYILDIFNKESFPSHQYLTELMDDNFMLPYRSDPKIDHSVFLKPKEYLNGIYTKKRGSGL